MLGITPTMLGSNPTMLGTAPTMLGTCPYPVAPFRQAALARQAVEQERMRLEAAEAEKLREVKHNLEFQVPPPPC